MKHTNPLKAILLALIVSVSCTQMSPIPKKTLQKIYYDLLVADSKMDSHPDLKAMSDSMAVYPGIFEKYGYTTEQFLQAQEYWVTRPEQFRKMLEANKKLFDDRAAVLTREIEVKDSIADALYELKQAELAEIDNFLDSVSFACMLDTILLSYAPSDDTCAVTILERTVDTTAVDTVMAETPSKKLKMRIEDPLETTEDEVAIEEDFEFKELEELEKASRKHQETIKKEKEKKSRNSRKQQLKDIEEKFK